MLNPLYFKAKDLIRNKKIKLDHSGSGLVIFLIFNKLRVFFDKRKKLWSCECRAEAFKNECYHVMACKILMFGDPAKKTVWKL